MEGFVVGCRNSYVPLPRREEVHAFINSRERQIGTYLFGSRRVKPWYVGAALRPVKMHRTPDGSEPSRDIRLPLQVKAQAP